MVSCFMKYRKKLCPCILWKWTVDSDLQCISDMADNGIYCRRSRTRPISRLGLQHMKCSSFQLTNFPITRFCLKSVLCCVIVMKKLIVRPTYVEKSVLRSITLSQKLAFRCWPGYFNTIHVLAFLHDIWGKLSVDFTHLVTPGRDRGLVDFILRSFCLRFAGCVGPRARLDALASTEIFVLAGNQIHIFPFEV